MIESYLPTADRIVEEDEYARFLIDLQLRWVSNFTPMTLTGTVKLVLPANPLRLCFEAYSNKGPGFSGQSVPSLGGTYVNSWSQNATAFMSTDKANVLSGIPIDGLPCCFRVSKDCHGQLVTQAWYGQSTGNANIVILESIYRGYRGKCPKCCCSPCRCQRRQNGSA